MDQLLLATWLFGYCLCLFSKGHKFHIRSLFLVLFFLMCVCGYVMERERLFFLSNKMH
jgi:hypothetical protein